MSDRNYLDGRPFYCVTCSAGFGEFLACEQPDCKLESEAQAKARRKRSRAYRQGTEALIKAAKYHPTAAGGEA